MWELRTNFGGKFRTSISSINCAPRPIRMSRSQSANSGEMEAADFNNVENHASRVALDTGTDEHGKRRAVVTLAPTARDQDMWNAMDAAMQKVAAVFAMGNRCRSFRIIATDLVPPITKPGLCGWAIIPATASLVTMAGFIT